MNSYERIRAAVNFETPDRVPVVGQVFGHAATLAGLTLDEYIRDGEQLARCQIKALEHYGYDSVFALMDTSVETEAIGSELTFQNDKYPVVKTDVPLRDPFFRYALPAAAALVFLSLTVPVQGEEAKKEKKKKEKEPAMRTVVGKPGVIIGANGVVYRNGTMIGTYHRQGKNAGLIINNGKGVAAHDLGGAVSAGDLSNPKKPLEVNPEAVYSQFKRHLDNHDYRSGEAALGDLLSVDRKAALAFAEKQYKEHPDQKEAVLAKGIMMYLTGEGRQAEELLRIRYASDSDPHWAFGLVRSYESNLQSQEDAKEIASLKKWARKRSMSAIYRVKRTGLVEDSSDFRFADELHKRNQ